MQFLPFSAHWYHYMISGLGWKDDIKKNVRTEHWPVDEQNLTTLWEYNNVSVISPWLFFPIYINFYTIENYFFKYV